MSAEGPAAAVGLCPQAGVYLPAEGTAKRAWAEHLFISELVQKPDPIDVQRN
jgi:hypothetical protein